MDSGTSLGPYRIERELGAGGMGSVYAATVEGRCPALEQGARVALKVVHPHLLASEGFFKRFLREGEIGQAVRHPNVVRTFDCDQVIVGGAANAFLVMEYVEGQTLRTLLEELERVPEELCRHIAREMSKGLAAIHAAGALHRDVKPDNVLITGDHVVKLMDLGVARLQNEALRLSQTGAFVGSIHYAAPEAFRIGGQQVDARADLHALGLVLYELACGTSPYLADGIPQVIHRVLHDTPRRLGEANPQLTPFFEEVVHCLLAKSPDERFASANELLRVLEDGEDSAWWRDRASEIRSVTRRPLRRVRIPRETAVYGREPELAKLCSLYERAQSGDGNVVLLEGEAGIGKSRLVDELIGRLQSDGEDINFLFGGYPPGGAATTAGGFSTAYRAQLGEAGCADHLAATPVLVPAFDALLRGEPTPEGKEALTKDSLQTCFVNTTRALAAERPTVVLIDDLHFAPDEGRALFSSLAMSIPGHRVLLIGTTRPGVSDEWVAGLTRLDHAERLALHRLGPKDLVRLLEDTLKSERLARELGNQIAVKSDGNPFFVFEILNGLREGQFISQTADGTWVGTTVGREIEIPSSVLDLVNARVSDLAEEERDLLDVACCWGFEFDPGLIGDVLGLARIPTLKRFGRIERRHRLVRAAGRNMVFDHHQVQEALYGGLLEQLREEYHAALAEALETRTKAADADPQALDGALCVDLCEHYLKGARGASALRYLERSQSHLTQGYLHAQVAALTERALAVPDLLTGSARVRALLRLATALDPMGRRARQEECALEAERLAAHAEDDDLRFQATMAVGRVRRATFRTAEAGETFERAQALAVASGDRRAEAAAAVSLGLATRNSGNLAESWEHLDRGLALAREIGDRAREARAAGGLGLNCWDEGRLREAREYMQRALTLAREIGIRRSEVDYNSNLGIIAYSGGHMQEARERYEASIAICREIGTRPAEAVAVGNLGIVCWSEGRLPEAREHYEQCLVLSRETGHRLSEARNTGNLAGVYYSEGRLSEARELHERGLTLSREIRDRETESRALFSLGRVHLQEGNSEAAHERFASGLAISDEIGQRNLSAVAHVEIGALHAAAGDEAAARASLVAAREIAAECGFPNEETLARCYLACLPGGDVADAVAAVAENDERLDADERRDVHWLLWKATGDRSHLAAARSLLDEAAALVDEETRESMRTNLRVPRAIMAAWKEHGEADADG